MSQATELFEIVNRRGLHARAASKLVNIANAYPCEIELYNGNQMANAKSVMGVLLLCCAKGTTLRVVATGAQAEEALAAIAELIQSGFGEEV